MQQLISQPTHLLPTSSTCIDLIFTDQPNLVVNSGAHPSLQKNCHHQISFCKLNLKIEYPPPYERLVRDYKKTYTNSIRTALKKVNWEFLFQNKNVHEQVLILNKTLLNVFSNYVPNKIVTFNDKDSPSKTQYLKSQINWHNNVYQEYHRKWNHSANGFIFLENVISEVSDLIFNRKNVYYNQLAQKLNDPKTSSKTYWSILKTFYDGKKVPLIPSLFIKNKLEPDF